MVLLVARVQDLETVRDIHRPCGHIFLWDLLDEFSRVQQRVASGVQEIKTLSECCLV